MRMTTIRTMKTIPMDIDVDWASVCSAVPAVAVHVVVESFSVAESQNLLSNPAASVDFPDIER